MFALSAILGIDSAREVGQALVSGIIAGSGYALIGAALALILGVTGRFHFALGSTYMLAAFITAVSISDLNLALLPAAVVGLLVAVVAGVLIELIVYRPVAKRAGDDALLPVFVASLGVLIAVENIVQLGWGADTRNVPGFPEHNYTVADVTFSLAGLSQVGAAVILLVGLTAILQRTLLGQQIRAVRGNAQLSPAVGVNVGMIFVTVFAIGSLMAGVAAILNGVRFAVDPSIGNEPIFYAFVVAFVAGVTRSPLVVGAIGLGIGVLESLSTIWVSENLSALAVFGLLFIVLATRSVRPAIGRVSGAISRARRGNYRAPVGERT